MKRKMKLISLLSTLIIFTLYGCLKQAPKGSGQAKTLCKCVSKTDKKKEANFIPQRCSSRHPIYLRDSQGHQRKLKRGEEWLCWQSGMWRKIQNWHNGKRNGRFVRWYSNGNKREEGRYKEGEKIGVWSSWYFNGKQRSQGVYIGGHRDGRWRFWSKRGKEKYNSVYGKGKLQYQVVWYNMKEKSETDKTACETVLQKNARQYSFKHGPKPSEIRLSFPELRIMQGPNKILWAYLVFDGKFLFRGRWTGVDVNGVVMSGKNCQTWKGHNLGSAMLGTKVPKKVWKKIGDGM